MKQTDKLFKEIIRISGDSYLDKYMYESGAAILEIYIDCDAQTACKDI